MIATFKYVWNNQSMEKFYKIQQFNEISLSWKDIQKRFETKEMAIKYIKALNKELLFRLMFINGKTRTPQSL